MIVIYRHRRLDTNEVFYVGMGGKKRPFVKRGRNPHWTNITNKTKYTVEVLRCCETLEEAVELEQFLITIYGRKDLGTGCLVNMTDGGEGTYGFKVKDSTKKKLRDIHKGKKYREYEPLTKKTKNKIGKANSKSVKQYNKDNKLLNVFASITEASNVTGVTLSNIGLACQNKRNSAGGFLWKYKQ